MKWVFFLLMITLASCGEGAWGVAIIPAGEDLVFSADKDPYGLKTILVNLEDEVMEIDAIYLINRICYLKLAFPEKDIVIDYLINEDEGRNVLEPRFINLLEDRGEKPL